MMTRGEEQQQSNKKIDNAIQEGGDKLTPSETARLRKILIDLPDADVSTLKRIIASYNHSEWFWGKISAGSKYAFLAMGAAVAFKAIFGDGVASFWAALKLVWNSKQ